MELHLDFYSYLLRLLKQIPEGQKSTIEELAKAFGDPSAAKAIKRALKREKFVGYRPKITENHKDTNVFMDFETERPLAKVRQIQEKLSEKVVTKDVFDSIKLVAGIDVAYREERAYSACIVMDRSLKVVEKSTSIIEVNFPYIPGYFSLREGPAILAAIDGVKKFDAIIVGAHGIAHPRGFGLASQIGLELDKPSIGVAKGLLVGTPCKSRGNYNRITLDNEVVGAKLCRNEHRPIYVSVGHKISLDTALEVIRSLLNNRLPEPLREAHKAASKLKKANSPTQT